MGSYKIDITKKYCFPEDICIVHHGGAIIVISPETANWVVLENEEQLTALLCLKNGTSIENALKDENLSKDNISYVITQLEARRLCSKHPHRITKDNRCLHLYLTNRCNLSCPHCYMFSGKPNKNELSTAEILKLLTDYRDIANGAKVTISGGEPSLHRDFEKIIIEADKLGLKTTLLTNGSLLDSEKIRLIAPHINSAQISIDGFSEESDSCIRGKGHFDKAIAAVEEFLNNGVETSIAVTPMLELLRKNETKYADFASSLMERFSGKPFRVKFAEELSSGRMIRPTKEENEEYSKIVRSIQKKVYDVEYPLIEFVETMSNDVVLDNCMFGELAVASNGDVFLCPELGQLAPIANIRKTPFDAIYRKAKLVQEATSVYNLSPCNGCELRYICGGGCRIKEFPGIKKTSFSSGQDIYVAPRECNSTIKSHFYDMMIESNEYLYISDNGV